MKKNSKTERKAETARRKPTDKVVPRQGGNEQPGARPDDAGSRGEAKRKPKASWKLEGATIGIDVGDRWSHYCCLNAEGEVVERDRIQSTREAMRREFEWRQPTRIALETGTHCHWMRDLLASCGHEVVVADAREVHSIFGSHKKNDPRDAEQLARLARVDMKLLHPVKLRGEKTQRDRHVLDARDLLVESRSKLIVGTRGMAKAHGIRLPDCSAESFPGQAGGRIPEELQRALGPLLEMIAGLSEQIRKYDETIRQMQEREYPETRLMTQVKGVGPITSMRMMLTIEDPYRFRRSRDVGSYVGLVPRRADSGESTPQLGISKAGDEALRRVLVNSAHYILGPFGPDTDLRRWGLAIAARGGKNAKKRAIVAVARKLGVLLHRLWVTGEVYEPLRQGQARPAAA
jgi:transposase